MKVRDQLHQCFTHWRHKQQTKRLWHHTLVSAEPFWGLQTVLLGSAICQRLMGGGVVVLFLRTHCCLVRRFPRSVSKLVCWELCWGLNQNWNVAVTFPVPLPNYQPRRWLPRPGWGKYRKNKSIHLSSKCWVEALQPVLCHTDAPVSCLNRLTGNCGKKWRMRRWASRFVCFMLDN